MAEKITDEQLESMLREMYGTKLSENELFHEDLSAEMNIKISEGRKKKGIRVIRNAAVVCAVLLCLVMPYHFLSEIGKGDKVISDSEISDNVYDLSEDLDKLSDFTGEDLRSFDFEVITLKSSSYYRKVSEGDAGDEKDALRDRIFMELGLVPYEETETDGKALFIRTINDGSRTVYTRQAYLVEYGRDGEISLEASTTEKISEEQNLIITSSDVFKGFDNADGGFKNLVSRFQRKNFAVKFDGVEIRKELDTDAEQSVETESICAVLLKEGKLQPVAVYSLEYTVEGKALSGEKMPEQITAEYSGGITSYSAVLAYDCTYKNSLRINNTEKNGLWNF
ncbi:hypothetical protein [Ruminococcus sp. HUN007]|uniref:hypothetical protein n=1 Tax=Ruminococcus sp. HUN007 TaxID=1514668 RepID=UPI0006784BBD|nr:hypothetical protein [Ruminococcus sp. HUN007]